MISGHCFRNAIKEFFAFLKFVGKILLVKGFLNSNFLSTKTLIRQFMGTIIKNNGSGTAGSFSPGHFHTVNICLSKIKTGLKYSTLQLLRILTPTLTGGLCDGLIHFLVNTFAEATAYYFVIARAFTVWELKMIAERFLVRKMKFLNVVNQKSPYQAYSKSFLVKKKNT